MSQALNVGIAKRDEAGESSSSRLTVALLRTVVHNTYQ